jgi:hypothetical protein
VLLKEELQSYLKAKLREALKLQEKHMMAEMVLFKQ